MKPTVHRSELTTSGGAYLSGAKAIAVSRMTLLCPALTVIAVMTVAAIVAVLVLVGLAIENGRLWMPMLSSLRLQLWVVSLAI